MYFGCLQIGKMNNSWFLIVNPNAGSGKFEKTWNSIQKQLQLLKFQYAFAFTSHAGHEKTLVQQAIDNGYRKIVAVGGDGTLHHILNGILSQKNTTSTDIQLGVIPIGTGNDWIRTYNIPNSVNGAIEVLQKEKAVFQDIGLIQQQNHKEYFMNMAGIGYDGYVVNALKSLKRFGSIAYLLSGLYGLLSYKKSTYTIKIDNKVVQEKCLMVLFGICQYSGGGMQMTQNPIPNDGLIDLTIAKNFSFFDLITNLHRLYNGSIVDHKKVSNYKIQHVEIIDKQDNSFIEADGELIGTGPLQVTVLPKRIQVFVNS